MVFESPRPTLPGIQSGSGTRSTPAPLLDSPTSRRMTARARLDQHLVECGSLLPLFRPAPRLPPGQMRTVGETSIPYMEWGSLLPLFRPAPRLPPRPDANRTGRPAFPIWSAVACLPAAGFEGRGPIPKEHAFGGSAAKAANILPPHASACSAPLRSAPAECQRVPNTVCRWYTCLKSKQRFAGDSQDPPREEGAG